jgi:hypothetical protein
VAPAFYDAADLQTVLGALKKLQRVLGEFNDARAQEQRLLECASAAAAVAEPLETKLALGRLADRCRERGDRLRGQVGDGLAEFRSRDTQSACRRAFERPVTPESLR